MIENVECIIIKCDNCGVIFEDYNGFSVFTLRSDPDLKDYDWHVDPDGWKHYCPGCHKIDENDNVIVINVPGNDPGEK